MTTADLPTSPFRIHRRSGGYRRLESYPYYGGSLKDTPSRSPFHPPHLGYRPQAPIPLLIIRYAVKIVGDYQKLREFHGELILIPFTHDANKTAVYFGNWKRGSP